MSENKSNNTSSWVKKNFKNLPQNCHLLDLACGYGQHSILAQKLGLRVTATDIDASKLINLKNFKNITTVRVDIENKQNYWLFKNNFFDVILISKYLFRPILNNIFDSIKYDGYLLYETFSEENKKFGKPNNPEYLLKQGELLNFSKKKKMKIIEYEEIIITQKHSKAIQRIFAKKSKF